MLVKNWSSEVTDQAKPINDGSKQISRDQIFFADCNFVLLVALLHYYLPYTLGCIAIAKHQLYESMAALQKNGVNEIQGDIFKFLERKVGNEVVKFASEDGCKYRGY